MVSVKRTEAENLLSLDWSKAGVVGEEVVRWLREDSSIDRVSLPSRAHLESLDGATNRVVYFVRCCDFVKVGIASDMRDRLQTLQVGCPYELTLMGTVRGASKAERALHLALNAFHARGEWFMAPPIVRKAIRDLVGLEK